MRKFNITSSFWKSPRLWVTVSLLLLASIVGCNVEQPATQPADQTQVEVNSTKDKPITNNNLLAMLKIIPDLPDTRLQAWFIDFARLRKELGIDLKKYQNKDGSVLEDGENNYVEELVFPQTETLKRGWGSGNPPLISGGPATYLLSSTVRRKNIGYGPLDIDQSILAGSVPYGFEAIKGSFDPAKIKGSISQYEASKQPNILAYKDVPIYEWSGETGLNRKLSPPMFDELGRGRSLAVLQDEIFASAKLEYSKMMIDADLGKLNSLADNLQFKLMADSLGRMNVITSNLSDHVLKPDNYLKFESKIADNFMKASKNEPILGQYTAFASGMGKDEKGPFMALTLIYDEPEQAKQDIGILRQKIAVGWSYSFNDSWQNIIESSEVWSEGRILCAKLRGKVVNRWSAVSYYEPLLVRGN